MRWIPISILFLHFSIVVSRRDCNQMLHDRRNGPHITCWCNETYCDDIAPLGDIGDKEVVIYTTSRMGLRFEQTRTSFSTVSALDPARARLSAHFNQKRQRILGFGGTFTDAATINLDNLPELARWNLLESYFGEKGVQYSMGRVPIASNDFSTRPYSYDEWSNDFQLENFTLADEDYSHKIPAIHDALNMTKGHIRLVSSPWSAPHWMKTNKRMQGSGALIREKDRVDIWKVYVIYLLKFFEAYREHGIDFFGITMQNEPNISNSVRYPWQAMYFSPQMEAEFIKKYLGPALRSTNFTQHIDILILDQSREQLDSYLRILEDKDAFDLVSGIALHWYADLKVEPDVISAAAERFPDKYFLYTEAANGWMTNDVLLGEWNRAERYIESILQALQNQVSGWIDYNLCLDMSGGPSWIGNNLDASVIVDKKNRGFHKQPTFYAIGHFSKFVRPGAIFVESELDFGNKTFEISQVVFANTDGTRVAVIYNRAVRSANVTVFDMDRPHAHLNLDLEPQSITTVVWKPIQQPTVAMRSLVEPEVLEEKTVVEETAKEELVDENAHSVASASVIVIALSVLLTMFHN